MQERARAHVGAVWQIRTRTAAFEFGTLYLVRLLAEHDRRGQIEQPMSSTINEEGEVTFNSTQVPRWLRAARSSAVLSAIGLLLAACSTNDPGTDATDVEAVDQEVTAPEVDTHPQSPEFVEQINLSRSLLDNGKADQALPLLEQTREATPDAFAVHNNLCVAYAELGRKEEAVSACRLAVELDPTSQLAKNNLAWVSSLPTDLAK